MATHRGLVLAVLAALAASLADVPSRHAHEAWEQDLAAHAHVGDALMVTAAEDCAGATHLHPVEAREHGACPACLTACGRAAAPGEARAAGPGEAPPVMVAASAPVAPVVAPRGSTGSRAPPRR